MSYIQNVKYRHRRCKKDTKKTKRRKLQMMRQKIHNMGLRIDSEKSQTRLSNWTELNWDSEKKIYYWTQEYSNRKCSKWKCREKRVNKIE